MNSKYNEKIISQYNTLSASADELYQFVVRYAEYINQAKDYGNGILISMVEVHTLTMIDNNPGVTVSNLAKMWNRTKGTVSLNVKKLEKRGLIYRRLENGNKKTVHLYCTESGKELSMLHMQYDIQNIEQTQKQLLVNCSANEVEAFYKVLHHYNKLFD
mgnify:CR=1 FL=1